MKSVRALTVGLLLSSVVLVVAFVVPADAAVNKTSSLTVKVSGAPKRYPAMITVSAKNFVRQLTKTATLKNLTPGTYTLKVAAIYSPTGKWVSKPPRKVTVKTGASVVVVVSYQKVASVGSLAVALKASPQGKPVKVSVTGPKGFKKTLTKSSIINGLQPGQYSVSGDDIDLKENLTAIAVSSDPTPMVLAGEKSKVVVNWNSRQASNLVIPPQGSLVSQNVIAGVGAFETSAVKAYRIGDPVLLPATQTERERVVIVSSISGSTVSVNPGSVYDALPVVDFRYTSALSPELQENVFSAQVTAQESKEFTFFGQKITAEWGCKEASKPVEINMKTTYTPILKVVEVDLNWKLKSKDIIVGPSAAKAVIRTGVSREMSLAISRKLSVECRATLSASVLAFTLGPIPFYVRGLIGLVASIETSPLTVEVGQTDTFSIDWGVDYSRKSGLKPVWKPSRTSDMSIDKLGSWSLSTKLEGKAWIEAEIELSPFEAPFEFKKDISWSPDLAVSADLAIGIKGKIGVGLRMTPKKDQVAGGSVATFAFQPFWYASVSAYFIAEASASVGVVVDFSVKKELANFVDKDFEPIGNEYFKTYTVNSGSSPTQPQPAGSTTTTTIVAATTTTAPPTSTTVPVANTNAKTLAAGYGHTCLLTSSGGVKCWGRNDKGQLGDGTTSDRATPVSVSGLTSGVTAVAAGRSNSCALKSGSVSCWGQNDRGQLGDGTATDRNTPVSVTGLSSGVLDLSIGEDTACALLETGSVKCWGISTQGSGGDNRNPVLISGVSTAIAVAVGPDHVCALLGDNTVKCWGSNGFGALGVNASSSSWQHIPVLVAGLSDIAQIDVGYQTTCAVSNNGALKCLGNNNEGQLGTGAAINSNTPVNVSGLAAGVVRVSSGFSHMCAVLTSGAVQCWGYNSSGQLGIGSYAWSLTPVDVSGISSGGVVVSVGIFHSCALLRSGTIKCWGSNAYGALGSGLLGGSNSPVAVAGT